MERIAPLMDLIEAFRPADLLDIAVVAILAHMALSWAKRAHSRFILAGVAALVVTYFVARTLDLRLTLFLFQLLVTVAVVAVVVIFQEDIRRAFERLGRKSLREDEAAESRSGIVDVLSTTAGALAKRHCGALIVIRGHDPLGRHLRGGVRLDGEPSEALLESIFDPGSAGHDGAVVIDRGRITRFGAHLPLSHNLPGGQQLGTRHAAGLGLAELSDALVIVVSEERGVVSVAQERHLEPLSDTSELRKRLSSFLKQHQPASERSFSRRALLEGLGTKAAALSIAVGGWIVVYGFEREQMVRSFTVPIVVRDLPEGWMVTDHEPNQARVTVTGPARAFRDLEPAGLSVMVTTSDLRPGRQQQVLSPRLVEVPQPLRVLDVEPKWVRFTAFRTETVSADVQPKTEGALPKGLRLVRIDPEPKQVKLVVREQARKSAPSVATVPIDLSTVKKTTRRTVALDPTPDSWLADNEPATVSALVVVDSDDT